MHVLSLCPPPNRLFFFWLVCLFIRWDYAKTTEQINTKFKPRKNQTNLGVDPKKGADSELFFI